MNSLLATAVGGGAGRIHHVGNLLRVIPYPYGGRRIITVHRGPRNNLSTQIAYAPIVLGIKPTLNPSRSWL